MNLIISGPPGSGKSTQSNNIVNDFDLKQVSTGDLLRNEIKLQTNLGRKIESILNNGELVADAYASGGDYTLLVDQGDSSFAGKAVSFKISGVEAAETADWTQGGAEVLDLVAAAGSSSSGSSGDTGATGAAGAKGAKGDTGATGPAGSVGAAGAAGSDGAAGAAGPTGPAGSAGSAGAAGAAGADGADGGGGLGVIALIVAIVALLAAGGSYMMGRRA